MKDEIEKRTISQKRKSSASIEKIKLLFELSYKLYKEAQQERDLLFKKEYELDITPLGEMEVHCDYIAGIAHSICNGHYPFKYLAKLKTISIENGIPHFQMIKKYPTIVKYIENWEKIRKLCIEILEAKSEQVNELGQLKADDLL